MADSAVFEWTSAALERATSFNSLQARGTVRLALKKAGLDASTVNVMGMTAVLTRVMPRELASRKIEDGESICTRLATELKTANLGAPDAAAPQGSPEDVFRRMFGGTPATTSPA